MTLEIVAAITSEGALEVSHEEVRHEGDVLGLQLRVHAAQYTQGHSTSNFASDLECTLSSQVGAAVEVVTAVMLC